MFDYTVWKTGLWQPLVSLCCVRTAILFTSIIKTQENWTQSWPSRLKNPTSYFFIFFITQPRGLRPKRELVQTREDSLHKREEGPQKWERNSHERKESAHKWGEVVYLIFEPQTAKWELLPITSEVSGHSQPTILLNQKARLIWPSLTKTQ